MSNTNPVSRERLEQAFHAFNQVSEQLTASYADLQQRIKELNLELATARNSRMHQLAEKERYAHRFALLLDALPAAVLVLDATESVLQFNPAAGTLFPNLAIGDTWASICDSHLCEWREDELLLHSGTRLSLTEQTLDNGSERILLLLDITEARELQARAERQQRLSAMGQMAAQLAHQIRTPLSSALIYSAHLARDDLNPEQRIRFAQRSRTTLLQMEQQINDMLAFTRGGQYRPEPVDLCTLMKELLQTLKPLAREHGVDLQACLATSQTAPVNGNRSTLLGAILNIARNALEHSVPGGRVTIEVEQDRAQWSLLVGDEGPGIAEQLREKIFDPFYTTRGQGTGLGLAVSQAVALGHGGSISVGQAVSGGALFRFTLPWAEEVVNSGSSIGPNDLELRKAV